MSEEEESFSTSRKSERVRTHKGRTVVKSVMRFEETNEMRKRKSNRE